VDIKLSIHLYFLCDTSPISNQFRLFHLYILTILFEVVKKYVLNQAETIVLLYLTPSFTCKELATKEEDTSSIDDIVFSVNTNKVLLFVVSQVILSLKESISPPQYCHKLEGFLHADLYII